MDILAEIVGNAQHDARDHSKLAEDIMAVLMMAAYFLRMYQGEEYAEEQQPETPVVMAPAHDARNTVLTPRTAGLYLPG